jgi:hypothetical protein
VDTIISFDIVCLLTTVPASEALQVIRNKLHSNDTLVEWSVLQFKAIIRMLEVCLRTTYFQVDDNFFHQKDGMAMGSCRSPIVSNIYMEHFEKLPLDWAQHKPSLWLWYVDDTFVVWPHGPERFSLRPPIQFTVEIESDSAISFLDVLVIRKGTTLATKIYRKLAHTGRYLNLKSNHLPHVKRGLVQSLQKRASTICQEQQDLFNEITILRRDLQLSGYHQVFINSVINSKGNSHPNTEEKPLGSVYILYVKGVSQKFTFIGNRYNIGRLYKTEHILRSSLMETMPERDPQQTSHCVCGIPCECSRSCVGETGRPLALWIHEHRHSFKEAILEQSKLAQHA